MPKARHRQAAPAAPHGEQLTAIRRLAEAGELAAARQRRAALRKAFPDFKPLLGLAWEIEHLAGEPIAATARAWEWQAASPNSRQALEALAESARLAGFAALMARALHRQATLAEGRPVPPPLEHIDAPLGRLTLAQAEAIDLSRMWLADDNPQAAAAALQGVDHPSAHNNLAMALFAGGEVDAALRIADAAWTADAGNLFALERCLRWRCWSEGMDRCAGFAATLRDTRPRRAEDASARVAALRFLGDHESAQRAWDEVQNAALWNEAPPEQVDLFAALGDADAEDVPGEHAMWFPRPWMKALMRISRESRRSPEAAVQPAWDAALDACGAHADYLQRAAELGDAAIRLLALAVLKRRASLGDAPALASLTTLLTSLRGPDDARMTLLAWLGEQCLRNPAEPARVRLAGSVREIRSHSLHINAEPRPSPYSAAGTALAERLHVALARRDLEQAQELARQLHAMHPEQPSTLTNLATIGQALGATQQQTTRLFEQAHAMAPGHLFARCGLARCRVAEGRLDEARSLLEGLFERTDWHYSEYRSLLLAQRALADAQGDREAVRAVDASLADIGRRFDGP